MSIGSAVNPQNFADEHREPNGNTEIKDMCKFHVKQGCTVLLFAKISDAMTLQAVVCPQNVGDERRVPELNMKSSLCVNFT